MKLIENNNSLNTLFNELSEEQILQNKLTVLFNSIYDKVYQLPIFDMLNVVHCISSSIKEEQLHKLLFEIHSMLTYLYAYRRFDRLAYINLPGALNCIAYNLDQIAKILDIYAKNSDLDYLGLQMPDFLKVPEDYMQEKIMIDVFRISHLVAQIVKIYEQVNEICEEAVNGIRDIFRKG